MLSKVRKLHCIVVCKAQNPQNKTIKINYSKFPHELIPFIADKEIVFVTYPGCDAATLDNVTSQFGLP